MTERLFVWMGGALFVAALVACAVFYTFVWSNEVGHGWSAAGRNGALLTLFALHHSVFARDGVKQRLARFVPARLLRPLYVWIASLLFLAVMAGWQPIGGVLYRGHGWRAVLGAAVQWLGVLLVVAAVRGLDPLELAGIRPESAADGLQTGGPYRLVRHPIYFGWILMVFGAAHMTGDRFAFAIITTAYLGIAIPWEERALARAFGGEYRRYQRQVRWRLIPFIY